MPISNSRGRVAEAVFQGMSMRRFRLRWQAAPNRCTIEPRAQVFAGIEERNS
jgi:hypothetical protein